MVAVSARSLLECCDTVASAVVRVEAVDAIDCFTYCRR